MNSLRRCLPLVALALSCEVGDSTRDGLEPDQEVAPLPGPDAGHGDPAADAGATAIEPGSCSRHSQCASDLCRSSPSADAGWCVPAARVLYVDRTGCASDGGDGSRPTPFCSVQDAVTRADGVRRFVRVYPGFYPPFTVTGKTIAIHGPDPGEGAAEITEEDLDGTVVEGDARVLLDRLVLGRHSRFGVLCTDASSLTIRRSEIASDTGVGLISAGCTIRLDRDRVSGLNGGMQLIDSAYLVTNTVFTGASERPAIRLDRGNGRILLSTITGNGDPSVAAPAVACNTLAHLVDTIVFGNATGADGSQLAGDCRLTRVVIGAGDPYAAAGAIRLDPELDDTFLPPTDANRDCCIDRAPIRPAILTDAAGTPRPQGPLFDIGADESLP